MKTLVMNNQKGGVGKSAIGSQLSFFAALKTPLRVVVIDLDHQSNTSNVLTKSGRAIVSNDDVLGSTLTFFPVTKFLLIKSHENLKYRERDSENHNTFADNFRTNLEKLAEHYDLCIVDTNPNPDIRSLSALVSGTHVLSPIELNQESIDGLGDLIGDLEQVTENLNPDLDFIGLLPNRYDGKAFQKGNLLQLKSAYPDLFLRDGEQFSIIPFRSSIAEAQASNLPLWEMKKTSARDTWRAIEPVFNCILKRIGVVQ